MRRRAFLKSMAAAAALPRVGEAADPHRGAVRPNILWISCEDTSPDLGCYGDPYAVTPNLDRLAAQGVRYTRAFSHAGVCAPARSGIITGMYPTTIGTPFMRCRGVPPPGVRCFPEYLRAAGYYATNNVKTDYQFASPRTAWDESSRKAHWRNRPPGRPFFCVINLTVSHESQIRNRSKRMRERLAGLGSRRHDPAKAKVPPYYPDTPITRRDWAQYHDIVTLMDEQAGAILRQLEEDGLAEDTIVWFWGDHGRGLPRAKRWIYDAGIHVPLIIRVPEKLRAIASPGDPGAVRPGTVNDDLVAFIDFGPTVLSLAGVKVPDSMQGRPFLGSQKAPARRYIFAARDRMDEAYDIIRAVRDARFKYIRNYMPYRTYGLDIDYMNQMPTMREMRRLQAEGGLVGPQKLYFRETKPVEELYDTEADPHEVRNLAGEPAYREVLARMRRVHARWMEETGDMGLIPEPLFDEMIRPGGKGERTAAPTFRAVEGGGSGEPGKVAIACATPGASIAYAIGTGGRGSRWLLYARPVDLAPGQVLRAVACRLGFRDSPEARFDLGAGAASAPQDAAPAGPTGGDWRARLDRTDLLARLRAIKALDGRGAAAIPAYLKALTDPHASVRYWAVVGLRTTCEGREAVAGAKARVRAMRDDPSPVVRIAVGHALCDWGSEAEGLVLLKEALSDPSGTVRLYAVTALYDLGERAKPAIPRLEAARRDPFRYVSRLAKNALGRLGVRAS